MDYDAFTIKCYAIALCIVISTQKCWCMHVVISLHIFNYIDAPLYTLSACSSECIQQYYYIYALILVHTCIHCMCLFNLYNNINAYKDLYYITQLIYYFNVCSNVNASCSYISAHMQFYCYILHILDANTIY